MHTLGLGQRNIRRREITDLIVLALLGQSTGASNIDCQQSGARVERLIVAAMRRPGEGQPSAHRCIFAKSGRRAGFDSSASIRS